MRLPATLLFAILSLSACAASRTQQNLDALYGSARVRPRLVQSLPPGQVDYWGEVQPILENRCVVCHGCFDAPCQLKQEAPEGLDRGGSKDKVYEPSRLLAAKPSRLFEDARTTPEWRERDFHPILNERDDTPEGNRAGSLLYRMLELKKQHPLPKGPILEGFDFAINRKQTCPTIEEFPEYAKEHPTGGMPYGLPGLSDAETGTIVRWLEEGAKFTARPANGEAEAAEVKAWEALLNGDTFKERLIARYVYEHLFMAHVYFPDVQNAAKAPRFYELVRSRTPPGTTIDRIASRRPFEDPGVPRVYYRLQPLLTTVLVKNHLPYALDAKRRARYRELFFDRPFEVDTLPNYEPNLAANPFAAFVKLPLGSRYRFLLDDAHFILDGFIKGPVCHGQTALNVIEDRFWITFVRPEEAATPDEAGFYAREAANLQLPAGEESNTGLLKNWLKYSGKQQAYLEARAAFLNQHFGKPQTVTLDLLWNGGPEKNPSAALTVFRHEDSATVVQGLVGAPPKTSWVLGYGLLERIHYLLVAGFDVYGNVGHQVTTRLYMDFLRMESEMNFLAFLPKSARAPLRDQWYEGAEDEARAYINSSDATFTGETGLRFSSMNPQLELYEQLSAHLRPVANRSYAIEDEPEARLRGLNAALSPLVGGPARLFPPLTFLQLVPKAGAPRFYSILRDDWHTNVTSLFFGRDNRRPEQDRLTLTRDLVGAYPNSFLRVDEDQIEELGRVIVALRTPADYAKMLERFGMRRTNDGFWSFSDALHAFERKEEPLRGGLFDFNRLENR